MLLNGDEYLHVEDGILASLRGYRDLAHLTHCRIDNHMRENIAKFLAHVKVPKIVRRKRLRVLECSNDTSHKVESYGMIKRTLELDIGGVQVERGEMNGIQSLRMLSEAVKS